MKNIVLISNRKKDKDLSISESIAELLVKAGVKVYSDAGICGCISYTEFPTDAEAIVVIGGDGSVIDASVKAIEADIPIVGVNLGKVGYLSEVEPENIFVLNRLLTDDFAVENKMLLTATHIKNGVYEKSERLAVNDVVISHNTCLGISDFKLLNKSGSYIKYRADGLIFSTPQGSTAYSLSAGGPIISHNLLSILVTPICPHSFFARSVVFSPNECIKIENSGDTPLTVSIDGRKFAELASGEECLVEASEKHLKMITFAENNTNSALFGRLKPLTDTV